MYPYTWHITQPLYYQLSLLGIIPYTSNTMLLEKAILNLFFDHSDYYLKKILSINSSYVGNIN